MSIDKKLLWQQVCEELAVSLSQAVLVSWVKPSEIESILEVNDDRVIVELSVPTFFHAQTIDERYYTQIREVLEKHLGKSCELAIKVTSKQLGNKNKMPTEIENGGLFEEIETGNKLNLRVEGLSPKFSLNSFVVGNTNNLAYAAAKAVVDNPGTRHNPFFIWGGVGVGKTHLMQAVGWELAKKDIKDVVYISSEKFTSDLVQSFRTHSTDAFKKKYRQVGALLIDDVQFFAGKETSQEEFFHTFNELHMKGVQIIMTSDKKPQEIGHVEDRLISRFLGGVTVDIGLPDFETRCAILLQKASDLKVVMDNKVVETLASKMITNARELEGTFMRLVNAAAVEGSEINLELIEKIVGIKQELEKKKIRPSVLVGRVAKRFNFKNKDLSSKSRKADLVAARHIAMYMLNHDLNLTLVQIGKILGGRDHTTVMHGIRKIEDNFDINQGLRENIMSIRNDIFA